MGRLRRNETLAQVRSGGADLLAPSALNLLCYQLIFDDRINVIAMNVRTPFVVALRAFEASDRDRGTRPLPRIGIPRRQQTASPVTAKTRTGNPITRKHDMLSLQKELRDDLHLQS